ncbi:MAG: hypothetical protein AB7I68_13375 [Porticoccaceae bacterium]
MKPLPAQRQLFLLAILGLALFAAPAMAQTDLDASLQDLRQRWAVANYEKRGSPRIAALDTLAQSAVRLTALHPDRVEVWIWSGIIQATLASAGTGINSLNAATAARIDLERALTLDPEAMEGAAYTTLGALYYKMPGWPVGFGDRKKAEELLLLALTISPNGMDSNYFYGDFLLEQGQRRKAREHLLRAQQAPPHPGDELGHAGRQRDIAKLLARIHAQ